MKFKLVLENNIIDNLCILTEANLNKIINNHDKDGYIILSACRQDCIENPKNNQQIIDENDRRTHELEQKISNLHYSYIPVYGGYKEENSSKAEVEKSFIVFPFDIVTKENFDFNIFMQDLLNLAKEYNQETIMVKRLDKDPQYYDCNQNSFIFSPFTGMSINDVTKEYFTALKSWSDISRKGDSIKWIGSPQRFTFKEMYLNKPPYNIMNKHCRTYGRELT